MEEISAVVVVSSFKVQNTSFELKVLKLYVLIWKKKTKQKWHHLLLPPYPLKPPSGLPPCRLTSLWMSRCMSRTAWRRRCRPFRRAAPPCPATPAPLGPAVAAGGRGTPPCLMPACPPLTRAPCRSSAPSTYSAVSPRHTQRGETESTWQWRTEKHSVKDWCAILSWLFEA